MYRMKGKLNPNWKGGLSPERQIYYESLEWKKVSKRVWKRDNNTCPKCGLEYSITGIRFDIHHIVSFSVEELRLDVNNLILLCKKCHHFVHSKKNINKELLGGDKLGIKSMDKQNSSRRYIETFTETSIRVC